MASEAEIERLYQLFVTNGGGAFTFSGANLTPKQYSDAVSASNLTPLQMAQLEARQHQYNRQKALNTISNELENNAFTNPYAPRAVYASSLFSALNGTTGSINAGLINGGFSGFTDANRALVVAGVLSATGVDLEKIIAIAGLMSLGTTMYTSLANHTNGQTADIPKTLEDASSLSALNQQFGEQGDPCSFFNQLMGILAGAFDGTLDFIETAVGDISSLVNKTGIPAILSSILSALTGAGGVVATAIAGVIGLITGTVATVLQELSPLVGKIINAIGDISTQIASEISSFADMAAELLKKSLALLIGSAAADPCKKAVLNNTGTPAMQGAIAELNQPLGTSSPDSITTSSDSRVDEREVVSKLDAARAEALLRAGVPQSPFTTTAKEYETYDSNIHPSTSNSSIRPKDSIIVSGEETQPVRKEGETMDEFTNRNKGDEKTTETVPNKKARIFSLRYRALNREWQQKQLNYTKDSRALLSKMRNALNTKNFTNKTSLKNRLKTLIDIQATQNQSNVENMVSKYQHHFYYWTDDGNPSRVQESKIRHIVLTRINPKISRIYNRAVSSKNSIETEWNSIDSQLY